MSPRPESRQGCNHRRRGFISSLPFKVRLPARLPDLCLLMKSPYLIKMEFPDSLLHQNLQPYYNDTVFCQTFVVNGSKSMNIYSF